MSVRRDFVTIVSGLPRSGTSMAMQMLGAGGLPALTDNMRAPDEDNPKGYYEFEPVKTTRADPSWLTRATGKAVKMVYRLLYELPSDRAYRVVFMRRDMEEVLTSQEAMLRRLHQDSAGGPGPTREQMASLFARQIQEFERWIEKQDCFAVLYVDYRDVVDQPRRQADRINEFLGGGLDTEAMAAAVSPSLYRHRR